MQGQWPESKYDSYRVPLLDEIFSDPPRHPSDYTEEGLREQAGHLEELLAHFKVQGAVIEIVPGPFMVRFEVKLKPGVKARPLLTLHDEIGLALGTKNVLIHIPLPGKSLIGIDAINPRPHPVYIKEVFWASEFGYSVETLKIALGKFIDGRPCILDLAKEHHLLIGGQTGAGKSVCLQSVMASFICSKSPDELRMLLIDLNAVELKPYDTIPHLLYPVITQADTAILALRWLTFEVNRRYEVLAQAGVRDISSFNLRARAGDFPNTLNHEDRAFLPFIVIVIDELAELREIAGEVLEDSLSQIVHRARPVGIHLIVATQRPSAKVITGNIKANLPTRIAFKVASQADSRTILDCTGAETLIHKGEMLLKTSDLAEPIRVYGCYVDDVQVERLVSAASDQFVNYPQIKSFDPEADIKVLEESLDDRFQEAAKFVVQAKQASVSLLQRRLGIGYARSGRILDQMERVGIVGKEQGSKPREVLVARHQLGTLLSSLVGRGNSFSPRDALFREAAELVVVVKRASASLLNRRLGIEYARAEGLIDQLEWAGIIGVDRGSKPREVLMDPKDLETFLNRTSL